MDDPIEVPAIELTPGQRKRLARSAVLAREQLVQAREIADEYTSHGGTNVALVGAILGALASNYLALTTSAVGS